MTRYFGFGLLASAHLILITALHLPMGETETSLLQEPTFLRYFPKPLAIPPESFAGGSRAAPGLTPSIQELPWVAQNTCAEEGI